MKTAVLTILIAISVASYAHAQTWVCDARASTGFSADRGYAPENFRVSGVRFTVRANPDPMSLTLPYQREDRVFRSDEESWQPASIQRAGEPHVALCTITRVTTSSFNINTITCDTVFYGDFRFNLDTGIYTRTGSGFESTEGSSSWVEVGECRRTD
jgi:hypothetical protein